MPTLRERFSGLFGRKKLRQLPHQGDGGFGGVPGFFSWRNGVLEWAGRRGKAEYADAVGDGLDSSVIVAPLLWMARTFPEAPVVVERSKNPTWEVVNAHPMVALLNRPNPYYSGVLLKQAAMISWGLAGNVYLVKVRGAYGQVEQLWYIPHWLMVPRRERGSTQFVDYYEYSYGSGTLKLHPSDVVHIRLGIDPRNQMQGIGPLTSILREVFTDDEAAAFTATLLSNMGVPGLVISPEKEGGSLNKEQGDRIKADIEDKVTGDRRGKPLVMLGPTKIQQFGFSPEQLNLKALRRIPEERVTAVMGIPAIVVGLGAGLDRSTFANYKEAREAAYESNIIPTQSVFCAELQHQLLPDFEARPDDFRVGFDNSQVRILQEDENRKAARYSLLYRNGVVWRSEARRAMGLDTDKEDDVFIHEVPGMVGMRQPGQAAEPKGGKE